MSRWQSLTTPAMAPVWDAVRRRLEQHGIDNRGRIALPPLDVEARRTVTALLGRPPSSQLDLSRVEAVLADHGVGADLAEALAALGHPVDPEPARRRAASAAGREARAAARAAVADWPEPWADAWIDEIVRAGVLRRLDHADAVAVVDDTRRVLDALDLPSTREGIGDDDDKASVRSRTDLAAGLLGSAHALDTGSRVEVAVRRALVHQAGAAPAPAPEADDVVDTLLSHAVWERAGVHLDLTSGPALVWNLPLLPGTGLATVVDAATAAGVPVHLTRLALERHPVAVRDGADVLVTENPRVVEAAAQRTSPLAVVSASGSPSTTVQLLVRHLLAAGASVRYHGDFDAAGLALCARMAALGVVPWRMTVDDYRAAIAEAATQGVELPLDDTPPPATPWDPSLQATFANERLVVHEERLLDQLLDPTS